MGYRLNSETGKMERITTVTGTITTSCGCHVRYDDEDPEHRKVRLTNSPYVTCEHGLAAVQTAAYLGPPELLIPDPVERAQFEEEMRREKSGYYDDMYSAVNEETDVCR